MNPLTALSHLLHTTREVLVVALFRKIEYQDFDDTLPEDEYQEQQIELLDIIYDKTKEGGSLFYNHKVRYDKGGAISPWQWLTKTKWNIREEIVWNR